MSLQRALSDGRRAAEALMLDSCRIERLGGLSTDPITGVASPSKTVVYEGRCKVQTAGGLAAENTEGGLVEALGAVTPVWSLYLHLPYTARGLLPGDVATITSATDPNLSGRVYRLLNLQSEKSHATAQRWNVKEVGNSNG